MAGKHLNIVVNETTANLIAHGAKDTGMSVSRFAAYVLQTRVPEVYPKERGQMMAYHERCEAEWRKKMPHIFPSQKDQKQVEAKTENENDKLLQSIRDMMEMFMNENKMLKDELQSLKRDLGC